MSLFPCPECGKDISDQAHACPGCGFPVNQISESSDSPKSMWAAAWHAVTKSKTPINIFALAMMACSAVFGYSASNIEIYALPAFAYALHTFLAIAGMFFLCLLFCRSAIYHPEDLAKAKAHDVDLGKDRPITAAVLIAVGGIIYGVFQGFIAPAQFTPPVANEVQEVEMSKAP